MSWFKGQTWKYLSTGLEIASQKFIQMLIFKQLLPLKPTMSVPALYDHESFLPSRKLYSYSALTLQIKFIACESWEQVTLANTRITN